MKVLLLYDYPPPPSGLATQGNLLYKGLLELGVDAFAANFRSNTEKEWYYRWFKPDVVLGVGYWGFTPQLILHPQQFGIQPVPWLVADGYIASYHDVLDALPLILVTSNWVKDVYIRDGIKGDNIEILPVGCNTDLFRPYKKDNEKIVAVRKALGISPDQLLILTVGGDAASKGAREVMQALAKIDHEAPDWKYVCKVWPQSRTERQNAEDLQLAQQLGIEEKVIFVTDTTSREFMPYLLGACDIYAAPSRLEGFGMPQVEAGACGKPVLSIKSMGMLDTLIHGKTAFLASVAQEISVSEVTLDKDSGYEPDQSLTFQAPRVVEYRASVDEIADSLMKLMLDPALRQKMGEAGRVHVLQNFDYRVVARRFLQIIHEKLGIE